MTPEKLAKKRSVAIDCDLSSKFLKDDSSSSFSQRYLAFYDEHLVGDEKCSRRRADMGIDLLYSSEMSQKCRLSESYSQNLYAALCNNSFSKVGNSWECSWRRAGGLVAEMRGEGGCIDWYCSGMSGMDGCVTEGHVTDEIHSDLISIGWVLV